MDDRLKKTRKIRVIITSRIDGVSERKELSGEYAYKNGAHIVVFTDYTGNVTTKNGMAIRNSQLLLHRTGGFSGDMLFDGSIDTTVEYRAMMVSGRFILHTEEYRLTESEEGLDIYLKYVLHQTNGEEHISGEQFIKIIFQDNSSM